MNEFADGLTAVMWKYFNQTGVRSAIVTMGAEGIIAFTDPKHDRDTPNKAAGPARLRSNHIPALGPIGIDPLGCGDALLATSTLAMTAGANLVQAGYLGSLAAAVESRQLGNVPVGAATLRAQWQRMAQRHLLIASAV
jgi:sugar/nucleoside kinase (ribokinase family)